MSSYYRHKASEGRNGWSIWVHPLPGYKLCCCDCGLVHELQFKNVGTPKRSRIIFRARRLNRSTALVRRHGNIKVTESEKSRNGVVHVSRKGQNGSR